MAEALNFDGPTEDLGVFDCPNCGQTIDASADVCRFCGAKIDHDAARKAAHLLGRVDQACSDASYLWNAAVVALALSAGIVFIALRSRLMLVAGFLNTLLVLCALVLIVSSPFPLWSMRWRKRYANLTSEDEDLQDARTHVETAARIATISWLASGALAALLLFFKIASR
jgi:hypothetical protein